MIIVSKTHYSSNIISNLQKSKILPCVAVYVYEHTICFSKTYAENYKESVM